MDPRVDPRVHAERKTMATSTSICLPKLAFSGKLIG